MPSAMKDAFRALSDPKAAFTAPQPRGFSFGGNGFRRYRRAVSCYVCDKHRAGDGVIAGDDLIVVGHVLPDAPGTDGDPVYLGHLIVEPRRHVPGLADLTPDEAAALGQWAARAAKALQAEHVYSQVIGHRIDHLHLHLVARYPGTPPEFWWPRLGDGPDAPRGGNAEVTQLMGEIRARLDAPGGGR
jgi:histidine triad (HIT) family protein